MCIRDRNNVVIAVRTARQVIEEVVPGAEAAAEGAEGAEKKEEGKKEEGKKEGK